MSRKIYITEAQLRNLMRSKINENIVSNELNIEDVYETIIRLVNNSEFTVDDHEWIDDKTLKIWYTFNIDSNNTFSLEVIVNANVGYSYVHEPEEYYDAYGNPGTPEYFDDNFNFKFNINPENITVINEDDGQRIKIDEKTYEAIINKIYDVATSYYEEMFDYEGFTGSYCYDDEPETCYRDEY